MKFEESVAKTTPSGAVENYLHEGFPQPAVSYDYHQLDTNDTAADDDMIDIETLYRINPVVRYIMSGDDDGLASATTTNVQASLSHLVGSEVLEDMEVMGRYVQIHDMYSDFERKTAEAAGDQGPSKNITATPNGYTEAHVRLALVILDSRDKLPEWRFDGECYDLSRPDIFYPGKGESLKEGKAVCNECAMKQTCLEYALSNNEQFGLWGGTSERERARIRKQRTESRPIQAN